MKMKIIITVSGGVVQDVFCSRKADVEVVDWDDIKCEDSHPSNEDDEWLDKKVKGLKEVY